MTVQEGSEPEPLVPLEVDLRDFQFMPLDVARLRDSTLMSTKAPEEIVAAIMLWSASWHQIPAGSLPDDDRELSKFAGYGRAVEVFRQLKEGALHRFVRCSDGRWYHPVVAEKALAAWRGKIEMAHKRDRDRWRKLHRDAQFPTVDEWNAARLSNGSALDFRWNGPVIPMERYGDSSGKTVPKEPPSVGIPAESPPDSNALARTRDKGIGDSGQGIVDRGEGQGIGDSIKSKEALSQIPPKPITREVAATVMLRALGVKVTAMNAYLHQWLQAGATDEQLRDAVERARLSKPDGEIPAKYLDPIVREVMNPPDIPPDRQKRGGGAWWHDERSTIAKGRELGIEARPGEDMPNFQQRIREAIEQRRRAQ